MEEWRPIAGYDGLYEVSNLGRVKSLGNGKSNNSKERILKPIDNGHGYLRVPLYKDGVNKLYMIHRLVAQVFCENPHGYLEVNHISEDKTDNRACNLEWVTHKYNTNYGTRNKRVAEKTSKPIFGIDKVSGLIVEFPSSQEASRALGIAQSNITKCCKGKLKSAGGFQWFYQTTKNK